MKRTFIILSFILFTISFVAEAKFWTKKDLLNAGFKFGQQPSYSEIIYGKKIDGKLNGIVWLKSSDNIYLGYMTNGEMAAPYMQIPVSDRWNHTGIQEPNSSYSSFGHYPMSFIVDEIYGINSSSEALRNRLKNGTYNISHIVTSFDDFILSGQKIPKNAWVEYVEYISDIKISNSFPEERIPKFDNEFLHTETIHCDGVYRTEGDFTDGGMYIDLPSRFDLRHFTISLDFMPTEKSGNDLIFSISGEVKVFIKDGKIDIRGNKEHNVSWPTKCPVKMNEWNHISLICERNTMIVTVNNCSKLATFGYLNNLIKSSTLHSYDWGIGENFKGLIKNIKITYQN